jgi:hypothetical protein
MTPRLQNLRRIRARRSRQTSGRATERASLARPVCSTLSSFRAAILQHGPTGDKSKLSTLQWHKWPWWGAGSRTTRISGSVAWKPPSAPRGWRWPGRPTALVGSSFRSPLSPQIKRQRLLTRPTSRRHLPPRTLCSLASPRAQPRTLCPLASPRAQPRKAAIIRPKCSKAGRPFIGDPLRMAPTISRFTEPVLPRGRRQSSEMPGAVHRCGSRPR